MTYYELESIYEGDVTKHCGLSIDEVDNNFYELESKLYSLIDELTGKFDKIEDRLVKLEERPTTYSWTMHDSQLCPPGTSNNAVYEYLDGDYYTMYVSGKLDYSGDILPSGQPKGNRFGVAIVPIHNNQKAMFPNATWKINETSMGSLWDEIDTNPVSWPTGLYLYPKVERVDGEVIVSLAGLSTNSNDINITIDWDENTVEGYKYIVDEDIELETILSRTVHDTEICPPGTSNDATYVLTDPHTMNIGGTVYYNNEAIPGTDIEKGYRVGVAIQPINGTTKQMFPDATWYINDTEMGSLWDEIDTNPNDWPTALYLYPKIERIYQNTVVSLGGISNCDNELNIKIQWNRDYSEEYKYIIDPEIALIPAN